MTKYNAVNSELIVALKNVLGDSYVTTDSDKLETYKTDEEANPKYHHLPEVVVFPENTEQVADVIRLANKHLVPVTPRGAGTGLAGGAIPVYGGIVLVMDRMDKILEINEEALYLVAQAGVRTNIIQQEAKKRGLLYAGDPCSSDSCQIGGNVSTNAGGNRAIKYGTTRDQVYMVEMVTPEGEIVTIGSRLAKKTTGYALEQLIVGSEGTLGIITQVTLKLKPLATHRFDLLAIFQDMDKALAIPHKIIKAGITPACMEFMENRGIQSCARYMKVDLPYADNDGIYIIVTVEGFNQDEVDNQACIIDEICSDGGAVEVLVADEERIWKARRNIAEAARTDSLVWYAEDIVVPIDKVAVLMKKLPELEKKYGIATTTSAHIGDGNIHVNALKMNIPTDIWDETLEKYHKELYGFVYSLGGRLSGEHGIGSKKIKEMEMFTNPLELSMMRAIKKALDPNEILNPGKIFKTNN